MSNVVLVLDKHAFFVFGVCYLELWNEEITKNPIEHSVGAVGSEEGKVVFTKNPVRSDGKPLSENQTSARVRSVSNVVLVLDKHAFFVFKKPDRTQGRCGR